MKSLQEILSQEPVFLNNWENKQDVIKDFEPYGGNTNWDEINILFASYGCDNYSGDAWVLFEKNGILYEVDGSHCSCFGLENQWEPEECNLDVLQMRLRGEYFGLNNWSDNNFKDELITFLGIWQWN